MMANLETFDEIIEVVLEHEGGYVDDPDDRGGATNWGVTQAVYENFVGYKCDKEEIKNMDEETAKEIYHEKFWKPSRADKLPAEVRETYFDMVVNHGQGGAVKILQQACNNKRKPENYIDVDGGIGPNTIRAAKNLKNWELQVERSGYYWNLVFKGSKYTQRTSQVKFIRGWIRRCFKL
jgi:lysozyme family protein|tara:strand:- start:881 stop:1417 length:537 start_codon:yes stop_codon:yes gene_type:complete